MRRLRRTAEGRGDRPRATATVLGPGGRGMRCRHHKTLIRRVIAGPNRPLTSASVDKGPTAARSRRGSGWRRAKSGGCESGGKNQSNKMDIITIIITVFLSSTVKTDDERPITAILTYPTNQRLSLSTRVVQSKVVLQCMHLTATKAYVRVSKTKCISYAKWCGTREAPDELAKSVLVVIHKRTV